MLNNKLLTGSVKIIMSDKIYYVKLDMLFEPCV